MRGRFFAARNSPNESAVVAGAATHVGPVIGFFHRHGCPEVGRLGPPNGRLCRRLGPVRLPAGDFVGNPVRAAPFRLVPLWASVPFPFVAAAIAMVIGKP